MWNRTDSYTLRYGCAVICIAVATGVRLMLDPILGDKIPFPTLFFAVLVASWYGGLGPGVVATLLGGAASARFLLPPRDSFAVEGFDNQAGLVLFLGSSFGIALLGGAMRRAQRRAESDVQERLRAEERLAVTFQSIGDGVISTDAAGRVTFLNPVAAQLTGWVQEEAKGKPLLDVFNIVNETSRQRVENPALRALHEGVIVGLANHTILIAKDGKERPIDDSAAPVRDSSGRIIGTVLVFRDITDRKRAEDALGERMRLLTLSAQVGTALTHGGDLRATLQHCAEALVQNLDGAFARIWTVDTDNKILELQASAGLYTHLNGPHCRVPVGKFKIGMIAEERKPHLTNAVVGDPRVPEQEWAKREGLVSFAGYPLVVEERLVGVMAMFARHPLSDATLSAMGAVADGIAVGIERRQAQERLREQTEWLQVTLASIGDAVIATDSEGKVTFLNAVAEQLTGWSQADAQAKPLLEVFNIVNEESRQPVENPALRALKEGVIVGLANHTILIAKDGFERAIDDSAAPMRDSSGRVIGAVLVCRDITERKLAEERERLLLKGAATANAKFQAFFEQGALFAGIMDVDGTVVEPNRLSYAGCGYTREEVVGKKFWDGPWWTPSPNLVEQIRAGSAQAAVGQTFRAEMPYFLADGSKRVAEVTILPIKDEAGRVTFLAPTGIDVTDRKLAEEQLRKAEQSSREILESISEAFFAVNRDWRFTYVNPQAERLLDRKPGDLLGLVVWDAYPGLVGSEFERVYRDVANKRVADSITSYYPDHDRWYEVQVYPASDGISIYFRDVTKRKQAEQAQQEAESRWRSLAEALPNLVWTASSDGNLDYASNQCESFTGFAENELLGSTWLERVIHPDDRQRTLDCWLAACADKGDYDLEYRIRRHDGEYHWFKTRGVPIRNNQGQIVKWFGTCTDIDDQKKAQQALEQSEQRFRQLADSMPQIVWTTGPEGKIDYQNRRWEEFTGLPRISGNDGWPNVVHPDDFPIASERWALSVQTGSTFEMEVRLRNKDSQPYRWHLVRTVPVHDAEGQVTRWFGTATDIQEQKRAEERSRYLAESSATLAGIVDYESTLQKVANLAVPYFADWSAVDLTNEDGSLRRLAVAHKDANKVRLVYQLMQQYPEDPESPTGVHEVIRTGKPRIVEEITDELLVQGAKDEHHLHLIRSLGLRSYLCVPLVVSGKALGALTFATAESDRRYNDADVTLANDLAHRAAVALENTQLYQALREGDRRKNEFLAVLAHELRNPLAPIKGALDLLQFVNGKHDEIAPLREMMDRQVRQMVHLIDDLLEVSRITSGKIVLRKERLDLSTVIKNAVEASRPMIDSGRHELVVTVPDKPTLVDGDKTRLSQVFSNLLSNSAKYTPEGGRIWVSVSHDDQMVVIRVRDTGMGIPTEMLPLIFEMFTQVDRNLGRSQGGLGIGLALVRSMVEMHGGTVEAFSDGPGKGSEFVVRLPLASVDLGQQKLNDDQNPAQPIATPTTKRRILVVDDNKDSAETLGMLLKVLGNEVHFAYDGPSALEAATSFRPSVVLLDIGLPGMSGHDVARRMRQMAEVKDALLIAQTGWGQEEDRRKTEEAGFNAHLVKPVDVAVLRQLLVDLSPKSH